MNLFSLEFLSDFSLLFLRVSLGAIFLYHGVKKLHYWKLHHNEQLSVGWLALWRTLSLIEVIGGAATVLGFFAKIAALFFCLIMIAALYFKIRLWKKRFSGEGGWEIDLVILATSLILFVMGSGVYSLDSIIPGS